MAQAPKAQAPPSLRDTMLSMLLLTSTSDSDFTTSCSFPLDLEDNGIETREIAKLKFDDI